MRPHSALLLFHSTCFKFRLPRLLVQIPLHSAEAPASKQYSSSTSNSTICTATSAPWHPLIRVAACCAEQGMGRYRWSFKCKSTPISRSYKMRIKLPAWRTAAQIIRSPLRYRSTLVILQFHQRMAAVRFLSFLLRSGASSASTTFYRQRPRVSSRSNTRSATRGS